MAEPKKTAAERKQEAFDATSNGIVEEVAIKLKKNAIMLDVIVPGINNEKTDYRAAARELIDKRELTINGTTYKTTQLDALIKAKPGATEAMDGMGLKEVDQAIPTRDQVNKIANAVGDAVKENAELSVNGVKNWFSSKLGAQDAIAARVQASTVAKLTALRNTDPSLKPFLTEVEGGTIEQMGKAIYDNVSNPNAPKIDGLAAIKPETGNDALRNTVSDGIYTTTFDATKKGISDAREKAYEENGFMGSMAKMMGPEMANFIIGILNFFIKMFGGEGYDTIPDDNQIHNASNVVAGSVRNVFMGDSVPAQEKVGEVVKKAVHDDLVKHREHYPAMTDVQFDQLAAEAAKGAQENYHSIPKLGKTSGDMNDAKSKVNDVSYQPATPEGYKSPATSGYKAPEQGGPAISV